MILLLSVEELMVSPCSSEIYNGNLVVVEVDLGVDVLAIAYRKSGNFRC